MKFLTDKEGTSSKNSLLIEEKDIFSDLMGEKGSSLFLGKYALSEVFAVFKKRNFIKDARERKLWPLEYHMDNSEYPLQRFQIFYREKKEENTVVDLKIREGTFRPKQDPPIDLPMSQLKFLILEWLTLQNPLKEFEGELTPLPGQKHPGLNLGKKVLDLFVYLGRLCHLDGLLAFPAYFHNALLFSRYFRFLNPEKRGEVLSIRKTYSHVSFKQLAWIVHLECLKDAAGNAYKWEAEEQICPLNRVLKNYFNSRDYDRKVKKSKNKYNFVIDWECFGKKKHKIPEHVEPAVKTA
jgi:hypothetical protein